MPGEEAKSGCGCADCPDACTQDWPEFTDPSWHWEIVEGVDGEEPQWLTRRGSGQDLRSCFFWPKPFLRYPMAGFGIFFLHVVTIGLVIPL